MNKIHKTSKRDQSFRLFLEGRGVREVMRIMDISYNTARGYFSAWEKDFSRAKEADSLQQQLHSYEAQYTEAIEQLEATERECMKLQIQLTEYKLVNRA